MSQLIAHSLPILNSKKKLPLADLGNVFRYKSGAYLYTLVLLVNLVERTSIEPIVTALDALEVAAEEIAVTLEFFSPRFY